MKTVFALVALAGLATAAQAQVTYNDSTSDLFDNSFGHLDISSVTVNHDASNIYFTIAVNGGSVSSPDWGKYMIAINTGAANADAGNGWGRPINWNGQLINFWVGSWNDGGGGWELRQMNGAGGNTLLDASYSGNTLITKTSTTTQNFSISRAALGLTGNQSFSFDVMTSGGGGGDPGVDHLSNSGLATTDWSVGSTAGTFLTYSIPAPSAAGLLGLAGVVAGRRRRA